MGGQSLSTTNFTVFNFRGLLGNQGQQPALKSNPISLLKAIEKLITKLILSGTPVGLLIVLLWEFLEFQSELVRIQQLQFIQDPDGIKNQGSQSTCYAQATVTCIRCAQVRLGLEAPQDAGEIYADKIISQFGKAGAQVYDVLPWMLPKLSLKHKLIASNKKTYDEAAKEKTEMIKKYVQQKIPVLIVVQYTKEGLSSSRQEVNLKIYCHAMVIMGVKGESWRVQNSWGEGAHNKGIVKMHQQSHIREAYIIYGEKDNV